MAPGQPHQTTADADAFTVWPATSVTKAQIQGLPKAVPIEEVMTTGERRVGRGRSTEARAHSSGTHRRDRCQRPEWHEWHELALLLSLTRLLPYKESHVTFGLADKWSEVSSGVAAALAVF
jgi:hypothetical protein